jgi:glutaredoxin
MLWLAMDVFAAEPAVAAVDPRGRDATLEVFVRDGCPHCADAEAFLLEWQLRRPGVPVVLRWVDRDERSRDALIALSRRAGIWPPGVPTFVYRDRVLVGFGDPVLFEAQLQALIEGAAAPAEQSSRAVESAPAAGIGAGWFGTLTLADLGLPLFTLAAGLLDGFNPCAMWVLLFLLSLLVHLRDRRRMALIAGTFVLVSGAIYYAFMAAWLNLFLAVGFSVTLRIGLALLAIAIGVVNIKSVPGDPAGVSLSIPRAARPGIYARVRGVVQARSIGIALIGVATLAVFVNLVELLCTAGLPAMYTAVLSQQGLETAAYHGYLLLYIAGYLFDDTVMVVLAVTALGSRRLTESGGRRLKLLSGVVMVTLGSVMLLQPDWLA